jgi:hypothetical protein
VNLLNVVPREMTGSPRYAIFDVKVATDKIHMIYMDIMEKKISFLQFNAKTNRTNVNEGFNTLDNDNYTTGACIDDFDYEYLYMPIASERMN